MYFLQCHVKRTERNSEFLNLLPRRGPKAFNDFIVALMETGQDHLAEALSPELAAQWTKANPQGPTALGPREPPGGYNPNYGGTQLIAPVAHPGGYLPPSEGDKEREYSQVMCINFSSCFHQSSSVSIFCTVACKTNQSP